MCGRYTNTASNRDLRRLFAIRNEIPSVEHRRFNIAPTTEVLIAVDREDQREAVFARWGLIPVWAKDTNSAPKMINARAETLMEKRVFKPLVKSAQGRCLVLADGWYEWMKAEDPKQPKAPIRFTLPGGRPFAFAGLWNQWTSPQGEIIPTVTIITTTPNRLAAPIHNRMPAVLPDEERWDMWLDPALDAVGVTELTRPIPDDLIEIHPANPVVNSVRVEREECLNAPKNE